ncbi:Protein ASI1 [Escovopsis weberi]|uniref:Protein ASI1 n=1 Tax=Escovopsis weberi TaxID=150374 RepID=A0A0M8N4W9_ESCWE|nr:Protein ASI1 [Escovopsis weberi]
MVDGLESLPVTPPVPSSLALPIIPTASASSYTAAVAAAAAATTKTTTTTTSITTTATAIPTITTTAGTHGASVWLNITALAWAVNVTRYAPILGDLVLAGPRFVSKLGSLVANPANAMDAAAVLQHGSPPPAAQGADTVLRGLAAEIDLSNIVDGSSFAAVNTQDEIAHAARLPLDGARGLGNLFNYATSRWAIACIVMAIALNRTYIFAAPRRRLRLRWHLRLLLRIVPILLLLSQAHQILQSIQCQTSPDFAQLRWGAANKTSDLMPSHVNGFLNSVSSAILLGASDEQSCRAVGMIPADGHDAHSSRDIRGSLSRLWPLFGTFCLSQFLDTVSCAVQGRAVAAETGMSLFEQSLAFAEVDVAVSNRFNLGPFSKPSHAASPPAQATSGSAALALTRSMILRRVNTPPEVLLIAFLSAMTHITSHVLGIFDLQAKYRLVNTGVWGLCFMSSIVWSAIAFDSDDPTAQGLLRFPTACIIRFVPHVLVTFGIIICFVIYCLALLLSALAPPANAERSRMSLWQRIGYAHENMQANISLSEVQITREMDFYTALLRAGFGAITMASEAVYLNEDGGVNLKRHTWLEEARYREAEELQRQWIGMGLPDARYDQIGAIGLIPVKEGPIGTSNGYGRERAAQNVPRGRGDRSLRVGIGASDRSSRWLMALDILLSINKLLARVTALSMLWFLGVLRIQRRPALLVWLAHSAKRPTMDAAAAAATAASRSSQTLLAKRAIPSAANDAIDLRPPAPFLDDVEAEFRRVGETQDEANLDRDLYNYWLTGGWWGSKDSSGDFEAVPEDDDWDATSVITVTTDNTDHSGDTTTSDREWSSEDEGQRTPTQRSPNRTRENTPIVDTPIGMRDLARLLQPSNSEDRAEAERLAAHFQSDRILTRSGFRRIEKLQRTRILTMPGPGSTPRKKAGEPVGRVVKLSPEEEEQLLEQLLFTRRQNATQSEASESPATGSAAAAASEGDGPPCVVCQCAPRTVIVWPCRCLSLCDDCRVSLAMNNFDKCVCCRRDVMSFSRIYVP